MDYVLEINDSDLSLHANQKLAYRGPGIALVRENEILFGEPALRLSRAHPRQTNQQYFARMNADPLPYPVSNAANHADLVYLHLKQLNELIRREPGDLVLAVPAILSADQLGVLLGIVQECGMAVSGFVDAAVAAASVSELPSRVCHLDMHLQRTCVTRLEIGAEVARTGADEVADCGLAHLLEGWVNVIADRFVRDTRFDPLHAADTEQQLYNQVYDWAMGQSGQNGEIGIEIEYRDQIRRVEVSRSQLEDKARQRFTHLTERLPENAHLALSARTARLPGLTAHLSSHGWACSALDDSALATGCAANASSIRAEDGRLRLVSQLPVRHDGGELSPATSSPEESGRPTHVLVDACAVPIGDQDQTLALKESEAGVYLEPDGNLRLNGEAIAASRRLRAGDEVTAGGRRYLLIRVVG